jgi:hypothetical protein
LAYLSYRGAVVVAGSYGTAVAVVIELNRFRLYERLRLPMPADTDEERRQNALLMRAFRHDEQVHLAFVPSENRGGDDTPTTSP